MGQNRFRQEGDRAFIHDLTILTSQPFEAIAGNLLTHHDSKTERNDCPNLVLEIGGLFRALTPVIMSICEVPGVVTGE